MNSFRSVERAIAFEIERQAAALDAGEPLVQETRGWDDDRGETYRMRVKETSDDYRYFPEPDLPPLRVDPAWLDEIRARLPELPAARRARYATALGLSAYDAAVLVADPDALRLFEATLAADAGLDPKRSRTGSPASTCGCATRRPARSTSIPRSSARSSGSSATGRSRGRTRRRSSSAHRQRRADAGDRRRARLPPDLRRRRARRDRRRGARRQPGGGRRLPGRQGAGVGFLVGQVMKATRGQANAALVQAAVRERLDGKRGE